MGFGVHQAVMRRAVHEPVIEIYDCGEGIGESLTTVMRRACGLAGWTPGLVLVEQPVLQQSSLGLVFQEAGE